MGVGTPPQSPPRPRAQAPRPRAEAPAARTQLSCVGTVSEGLPLSCGPTRRLGSKTGPGLCCPQPPRDRDTPLPGPPTTKDPQDQDPTTRTPETTTPMTRTPATRTPMTRTSVTRIPETRTPHLTWSWGSLQRWWSELSLSSVSVLTKYLGRSGGARGSQGCPGGYRCCRSPPCQPHAARTEARRRLGKQGRQAPPSPMLPQTGPLPDTRRLGWGLYFYRK